jgi:hypothetical protein
MTFSPVIEWYKERLSDVTFILLVGLLVLSRFWPAEPSSHPCGATQQRGHRFMVIMQAYSITGTHMQICSPLLIISAFIHWLQCFIGLPT